LHGTSPVVLDVVVLVVDVVEIVVLVVVDFRLDEVL